MALDFPTRHLREVLSDLMPSKLPLLDLPAREKLNMGSGDEDHGIDSAFTNIDLEYTDHYIEQHKIDARLVKGDISDLHGFAPGSVSVIYAHHSIEHVDRRDVPKTLKHWASLLRLGGLMYIGIPDSWKAIQLADREHEL